MTSPIGPRGVSGGAGPDSTRRGYATAVLKSIVQAFEGKAPPVFIPALFISLFTLMVLIVRP